MDMTIFQIGRFRRPNADRGEAGFRIPDSGEKGRIFELSTRMHLVLSRRVHG